MFQSALMGRRKGCSSTAFTLHSPLFLPPRHNTLLVRDALCPHDGYKEGDRMANSKKLIRFLSIACVAIALVLAACLSAGAEFVLDNNSDLYGSAGSVHVYALVTKSAGIDDYSYTVTYTSSGPSLHSYGVGNDNWASYFGAWASKAWVGNTELPNSGQFTPPTFDPNANTPDLEWLGDANRFLDPGQTRYFGYQSIYAPMTDLRVYCWLLDGGVGVDGDTIGMGTSIPEPASIFALGCGLIGLAPLVLRRRK